MARAAGLSPQAVGPDGQTINGKGGVVIDQTPAAGEKVDKGCDIALRIAFGGGPAGDREPLEPLPQPHEFHEWVEDLTSDDLPPSRPDREPELVGSK